MAEKNGRCLIMSAGDDDPAGLVREPGDILIAADNGLTYLDRLGLVPDYIIGDYDSLVPSEEKRLRSFAAGRPQAVTTLPVEKDDTDTLAAVRLGFQKGYRRFVLYGALGGSRLDHTLANIQTLKFIQSHGGEGRIEADHCRLFVLSHGTWRAPAGFRGDFSVFALDERVRGVTIRGMKYNAVEIDLTNDFPLGVSNHIDGPGPAEITVTEGTALICLSWAPGTLRPRGTVVDL